MTNGETCWINEGVKKKMLKRINQKNVPVPTTYISTLDIHLVIIYLYKHTRPLATNSSITGLGSAQSTYENGKSKIRFALLQRRAVGSLSRS